MVIPDKLKKMKNLMVAYGTRHGLEGALAGATSTFGLAKLFELINYGVVTPNLYDGVPSISNLLAYPLAMTCGFLIGSKIIPNGLDKMTYCNLKTIQIDQRKVEKFPVITEKTNTGNNAAIFVSNYYNGKISRAEDVGKHRYEGKVLEDYIQKNKGFLGVPIQDTNLVYSAKSKDIRNAIRDPLISSIVLIGHSSFGSWAADDKSISWKDIAEYTTEAGHCKNGFALKTGCNVIRNNDKDRHEVLMPAYSGSNGQVFISQGREIPTDYKGGKYLPGSTVSHGVQSYLKLFKLVPADN